MVEMIRCVAFALLLGFFVIVARSEKTTKEDDVLKCIPTGEPKGNVEIKQSEHDDRPHKYLTLDNKLRILLVSDPSIKISAGAAIIHAGYASDPPSVPGLAHFLEHMLFQGTEKYPEEGGFMNFLGQNGGETNAGTAIGQTFYFFSIKSEYLRPALDRFSQFFVAPLLDTNSTDREISAVEQEYQKVYGNDWWRIDYIKRSGSKPGHPFGSFGVGNKETLKMIPQQKSIDLRKMLLEFYNKYYSSNIMAVTVVGKESLEDLENMVVPMFMEVKNRNAKLTSHTPPYGKKQMAIMTKIPTIQDMNLLEIIFQVPDLRCFYKTKPLKYFSHIIAHKGKGSFISRLKTLGWAQSVKATVEEGLIGFQFFVVQAELTKTGLERVDDIITLLFQYLKMIRTTFPVKWIHDEIRNLDNLRFTFKDKMESSKYAQELIKNLQAYEAENVIDGKFVTGEFMQEKVSELFDYFTPDNFRYYISSKTFKGPWNRHAKYYDTGYSEHKIPKWKLMKWKSVTANSELHLPVKNPFVPEPKDLKVVVPKTSKPVKGVPVIIKDSQMVRVWYKADDTFYLPKSTVLIEIHSPNAISTPGHLNNLVIFVDLVRDAMTEYGYAAKLAGVSYKIKWTKRGLSIEVYGFSSKQDAILLKILHHVVSIRNTMTMKKFHVMKQKLTKELKNADMQEGYLQASNMRKYVISELSWNADERLQYISELTMESLKQYIDVFLHNIYIEGLFCGNLLRSSALSTFNVAEMVLLKEYGAKPMLPIQHLRPREYSLMEGNNYLFEKRSSVHSFSAIWVYFQVGLQTERNNVLCEMFNQMIFEQMFDTLRTKQQLGYYVYSDVVRSESVVGVRVLVQSDKQPSYVEKRIENFFESFKNDLQDMSDKKYKDFVEATAVKKLKKPKKLLQEAKNYAEEIQRRQFNFRRAEKEVELLRKMHKEDVIKFFKRYIDPASERRKRLTTVLLGKDMNSLAEDDEANWTVIGDILKFKASRPLYEHVLPSNNIPLLSYEKINEKEEL